MSCDQRSFLRRVLAVKWWAFETAYAPAVLVPLWLILFRFAPRALARMAGHKLNNGLCHQHAYVSSAALPAAPFIVEALERKQPGIVADALDMILGFLQCTDPRDGESLQWHKELRAVVLGALPRVRQLSMCGDAEVAEMAKLVELEAG